MTPDDYLPISKLNTVVFCARRYYIESILGETLRNHHLAEGSALHERSERQGADGWVWSDRLRLVGIVDQVTLESNLRIVTEFKKGWLGEHHSDAVQVCALGICLEEMHGETLPYGYVYYASTRRKLQVDFTPDLRADVEAAVALMRRLETTPSYPPITDKPNKCRGCSVRSACQPELGRA